MSARGHVTEPGAVTAVRSETPDTRARLSSGRRKSGPSSESELRQWTSPVTTNGQEIVTRMAVRFPETSSRYWGPSNTFVTKTKGTKYVTDQVKLRCLWWLFDRLSFQYTALLSSVWGLEEMEAERERRRKVEKMLSSGRMDRMVKSSSVLQYQEVQPRHSARPRHNPRTLVTNAKTKNQSEVNRLGVVNGYGKRYPVHREPHQRPIKRTWRPPHYKPPLFGFLMKSRRRQDVNRHLSVPSKPYRPPPQRSPAKLRPRPPPSKPPLPPGPAPAYRPQYLPPAQPTPYQVRMSSLQPLTTRTAVISG